MTGRAPIAPFELDPASAAPGQIELIEPEADHPLPATIELAPGRAGGRRPWRRLVWGAAGALVAGLLGIEAYDLVTGLFARSALLGGLAAACLAVVAGGALGALGREVRSLRRLARIEDLRARARPLIGSDAHGRAERILDEIAAAHPSALATGLQRFRDQVSDASSDGERLRLFGQLVLAPVDRQAQRLVVRAARDIGVLTALSPLGLLDGAIVLARTLAMLRAIAGLYGVRPGPTTTLSLLRRTLRNVLAAGIGELLGDAAVETAGASLLGVLSAKAGQGVVNGVLAARLGLTAMQLCRPLPFAEDELPSIRQLRAELLGASPDRPDRRPPSPAEVAPIDRE